MKLAALALASVLALAGCNKGGAAGDDPHAAFKDLSVDEVSSLVTDKKAVAVDANNADTRQKLGVLPGAVLLTSYDKFATSELPADKATKLVFYCGGQQCTAAPKAADVAKKAGYSDVAVMRSGIKGWVAAGKQVDKPAS
jgi:rhodanese-related sulfurtransferase